MLTAAVVCGAMSAATQEIDVSGKAQLYTRHQEHLRVPQEGVVKGEERRCQCDRRGEGQEEKGKNKTCGLPYKRTHEAIEVVRLIQTKVSSLIPVIPWIRIEL